MEEDGEDFLMLGKSFHAQKLFYFSHLMCYNQKLFYVIDQNNVVHNCQAEDKRYIAFIYVTVYYWHVAR